MFNPVDLDGAEWANIFEEAGAKYVVLTTKHHEGYAMWDSNVSQVVWGRPWNSMSTGPKTDIVKKVVDELKRRNKVGVGLYYSLSEWYNPVWLSNSSAYVGEYMQVQLRDIVDRFEPDLLFPDGEWDYSTDFWKAKEFLAWLYTNSSVRDRVVTNGRWGADMDRKKGPFVGNYMALEYDGGDATVTGPGRSAGAWASRSATTATSGPTTSTPCRCCS